MAKQERAMSPEQRAKISATKRKQGEAKFRIDRDLIEEREEYIQSDAFRAKFKGSNFATTHAVQRTIAERIDRKVREDGERMELADEVAYRERTGYGTEAYLKKLKEKLAGNVKPEETKLSDDELFADLDDQQEAA